MSVSDRVSWGLMAFLSVGVGGYALFHVATGFRFLPPDLANNGFPTPLGLRTHIAAAAIGLMLGPFQFLGGLRSRARGLHRWLGRLYVAACLIGGIAGGAIAMFSFAGKVAGIGFLSLAVLWLITTSTALFFALRRDFVSHERWMVRSFALTLAAVTLRLYLGAVGAAGLPFEASYVVIAWACWVPNLILGEVWLASRRPGGRVNRTAAA